MTPRQRMLKAVEFDSPDKIPVIYHPSPAGLFVHGENLLSLFNDYPPDNPIVFDAIPCPPASTIDSNGAYHEFRTDAWGTEWEYLIFGVLGHPKSYPFASWEEASDYQFPSMPALNRDDLLIQRKNYLVFSGGVSIFERLHALRPMEEVLIDIYMKNPALLSFLDRLVVYWLKTIDTMINSGVDVIMFGDDWGTQLAPLISPELFQNIFKPRYEILMTPILKADKKIFFHSCGFLGGVLDDLIELGISGLWPQISLLEKNPPLLEKCLQNQVALYIHPDRQYLVPRGSPEEIEAVIRRYAEKYHTTGGGAIFYVEIENDAPFQNVKTMIEAIHSYR